LNILRDSLMQSLLDLNGRNAQSFLRLPACHSLTFY
jgi:hypothetical protein